MQALFGFGPSSSLDVVLTNVDGRLRVEDGAVVSTPPPMTPSAGSSSKEALPAPCYIFSSGESIEGEARIDIPAGKKVEHMGIRAELKGVVGECRRRPSELREVRKK
jgi:Vacuolar protein sorting-associated protein 26